MTQDTDDGSGLLEKKREFLESFFRKGAEFTRELLRENDGLRRRLVQLEADMQRHAQPELSSGAVAELVARLHQLEQERQRLLERFGEVDAQEHKFFDRYMEIEHENNDLASLYVAKTQLHSSLDAREVVQIIFEILLNFVGASRFALYLLNHESNLCAVSAEGLEAASLPSFPLNDSPVGAWCKRGAVHLEDEATSAREPASLPLVCIPLREGSAVIGAVLVWGYFRQKDALATVDRRIFDLLASSGGRALEAARLASHYRHNQADAPRGRLEDYQPLIMGQ